MLFNQFIPVKYFICTTGIHHLNAHKILNTCTNETPRWATEEEQPQVRNGLLTAAPETERGASHNCFTALERGMVQTNWFLCLFLMCKDGCLTGGGSVAPMAFAYIVKRLTGVRKKIKFAAGFWIGSDLWVNWTSSDAVNRQLTFILANLHLSELKC